MERSKVPVTHEEDKILANLTGSFVKRDNQVIFPHPFKDAISANLAWKILAYNMGVTAYEHIPLEILVEYGKTPVFNEINFDRTEEIFFKFWEQ